MRKSEGEGWCRDTHNNDSRNKDSQHDGTQQHNNKRSQTIRITMLSIVNKLRSVVMVSVTYKPFMLSVIIKSVSFC